MKPRILSTARHSFPLATAIAALFAGQSASASTFYWDNNATTAGFGSAEVSRQAGWVRHPEPRAVGVEPRKRWVYTCPLADPYTPSVPLPPGRWRCDSWRHGAPRPAVSAARPRRQNTSAALRRCSPTPGSGGLLRAAARQCALMWGHRRCSHSLLAECPARQRPSRRPEL